MAAATEAATEAASTALSPDNEWPEAWYMPNEVVDQCKENRFEPNKPFKVEDLKKIGIAYWKMDATDSYEYPKIAVPWNPKDAMDPKLQAIRDDRGYSYADVITVHKDTLPDFENKIKSFFEEHIHDAEEIRYILGGSGYFDVRDLDDNWVRILVKKGDLITLPEGIYHRFTCDCGKMCHAMRLFKGQPVWTPFNRPQEEHLSRKKYVSDYVVEEKEKEEENDTDKKRKEPPTSSTDEVVEKAEKKEKVESTEEKKEN